MAKIHNYFSFRKHGQRPQPDRALTNIRVEDLEALQNIGYNRRNSIQGYEHLTTPNPGRSAPAVSHSRSQRRRNNEGRAQSIVVESRTEKAPKGTIKRPFFQRFKTDGIGRVLEDKPASSSNAIHLPQFQLYSRKHKGAKSKSKSAISAPVVIDAFDEANYGRSVPIPTPSTAQKRQEQHKNIPRPIRTVQVHNTHVNPPRTYHTSVHLAPLEAPPLPRAPRTPYPSCPTSTRRITRMTDLLRTPSPTHSLPNYNYHNPSPSPSPSASIQTTYTTPLASPFAPIPPLKDSHYRGSSPRSPWSDFEFDYRHLRDPMTPMTPSIYPSSPDTPPPSPPLDNRVSTYSVWGSGSVLMSTAPPIPPQVPEDKRRMWAGEGGSPRDSVFYGFWDEVLGRKASRAGRASRANTLSGKRFHNGL